MPVHDMTRAASSIVGKPATGAHARCPECGYGCVQRHIGGVALLIHSARCPSEEAARTAAAGGYVACANPECRKVLDPDRVKKWDKETCNGACRAAAWKRDRNYGRHDAEGVRGRANGSQRVAKPSGAQVSYRKAVEAVAVDLLLRGAINTPEAARWTAEQILRPALSERQRKQLEDRESERGSA